MKVNAKAAKGDRVSVLVGWRWHAATVESVGYWSHPSGNDYPVFTVVFRDGARMLCGNNSVRRRGA